MSVHFDLILVCPQTCWFIFQTVSCLTRGQSACLSAYPPQKKRKTHKHLHPQFHLTLCHPAASIWMSMTLLPLIRFLRMQHHSDRRGRNKTQENELSDKPKQWLNSWKLQHTIYLDNFPNFLRPRGQPDNAFWPRLSLAQKGGIKMTHTKPDSTFHLTNSFWDL